MAAAEEIKSSLDLSQIAQFLGTDEATASSAVDQALAQLVGAAGSNAADGERAVGLSRAALKDHAQGSAFGEKVELQAVDTADGEKIVNHLLSDNHVQALSAGSGDGLLQKLLPMLAPLVMGYLASKLQGAITGGGAASSTGQSAQSEGGLGGLGDLLGGLLGGGSQQQSQQGQSAGGGDLLGGLLKSILGG